MPPTRFDENAMLTAFWLTTWLIGAGAAGTTKTLLASEKVAAITCGGAIVTDNVTGPAVTGLLSVIVVAVKLEMVVPFGTPTPVTASPLAIRLPVVLTMPVTTFPGPGPTMVPMMISAVGVQ